jgi:hypothetical protein
MRKALKRTGETSPEPSTVSGPTTVSRGRPEKSWMTGRRSPARFSPAALALVDQ